MAFLGLVSFDVKLANNISCFGKWVMSKEMRFEIVFIYLAQKSTLLIIGTKE